MIWCSDFETTTDPDDCRVWGWKSIDIYETTEAHGTDIQSFHSWLGRIEHNDTVYFHNLKFDGEFLLCYLLSTGYSLHTGKGKLKGKEFTTLISDMGQWYCINICTKSYHTIHILDSLKIWNFSIFELAKSFGMEISKGEIDYELYRPIGYAPTPLEWDYIDRDVRIDCRAMRVMLDDGYTKMTAGSNALASYRQMVDNRWEYWFPLLSSGADAFIRKSYRGGWVYTNPKYQSKVVGKGKVYDVNSLYPSRMYDELLPYGDPIYYTGKPRPTTMLPLYVQRILVDLKLKKGYFPTLQDKHNVRFGSTEYITSTAGESIELTLTNIDLALMLEHYEIKSIEYIDGYYFKGAHGMFKDYIDHWMKRKELASEAGDKPRRNQSKLFMNSLYGKFAKRPVCQSKIPSLSEDGSLKLTLGEEEETGGLYIPIGTFITSYARNFTIRSAQKLHSRFLYADTDSLHLVGEEEAEGIEVHETHLGKWKEESTFSRAIYLGAKCYAEEIEVSRETLEKYLSDNPDCAAHVDLKKGTLLSITCAGMPDKCKHAISFDDFRIGLVVTDKLVPKHVPGGIVLQKTKFEVKRR